MLKAVDSLDLASNVVFTGGPEEVFDGGVRLVITTENLLGLEDPTNCNRD